MFGGQSLARKAMGPQEMLTQLPGYNEEGNRTLVQKVKDMFSSKEASDIEKLAYATALEKEAYMGTLGGGILGGAGGALMSEPGYRADSFGHGALRGAGAGAGAGIGGLAGLLAAYKMSRKPGMLPTNAGGPASTSTSNKIIQSLLPLLGAAGGGVVGYGASKALGGESRLEKKRRKEEENEKEAGLGTLFGLGNMLRAGEGNRAEGFGRGFGTGVGADIGAGLGMTAATPSAVSGANRALSKLGPSGNPKKAVLMAMLKLLGGAAIGGTAGGIGASKLMGKPNYAKKEAAEATTSDLAKGVAAGGVAGAGAGVGHNYLQNRTNYNNLVKSDTLDYVEELVRHGGFKGKLTPLRMTKFKGPALKGGLGGAGLGLLLAALMGGKEKEASAIQELAKEAGERGLWDNVHAKRERGEEPAKKGDKDYPDEKSWKKTTKASK